MSTNQPVIVISAINIFSAGPLSILRDCLNELKATYATRYKIFVLVHRKSLFEDIPSIEFVEFPLSRRSYAFRLYYEYVHFRRFSKKVHPHLWLSLHDITPNVDATTRAVYCHNPAPFYEATLKDLYFAPSFYFFSKLYSHLYRINLAKNQFVVVQHNWFKEEFVRRYGPRRVLVATPDHSSILTPPQCDPSSEYSFLYPSFPRSFKNFELVAEAVRMLKPQLAKDFSVSITIDGSENRYSRYIHRKYCNQEGLRFIGIQPREKLFELYAKCNCLIFPSKLETWGLPISEFECFKKPILASDLPYAHETVGDYDQVGFFNPNSPEELASQMSKAICGDYSVFTRNSVRPPEPDAANWSELMKLLLGT